MEWNSKTCRISSRPARWRHFRPLSCSFGLETNLKQPPGISNANRTGHDYLLATLSENPGAQAQLSNSGEPPIGFPTTRLCKASISGAEIASKAAHAPAHGSKTSIPISSKSRTLRVATFMPRNAAIAAIWQSNGATGHPIERRTASLSNRSTRFPEGCAQHCLNLEKQRLSALANWENGRAES